MHSPAPPRPTPHRKAGRSHLANALLTAALLWAGAAQADESLWRLLKNGGQVVLIRHAQTEPGVGDPPGFALGDCATQRNLSDAGRAQAQRLGAAFRERGVAIAGVLSSPWCRCIETAQIAFGGARTHAGLGNLFEHAQNREAQIAAFRALIAKAPKQGNLVLVTHGSTTLAFTGLSPAPAEIVIVTPGRRGEFRVAGRIALAEAQPLPSTPTRSPS